MSDSPECQPPVAPQDRRAELRVPASTLGNVRSRLVGGSDFALLNYTSQSLYGQSRSRLLVGARISVRLATATLNAIVTGRVVRSKLTAVTDGVPSYEVAVSLEHAVDWSPEARPVEDPVLDEAAVAVPVLSQAPAQPE
jgi:hypothetical protein